MTTPPHEIRPTAHEGRGNRAEQINNVLFRISNAVSTTKDLKELYSSLHRILGDVIDLTNFFIAIYDKDTKRVSFPYFVDQYDSDTVYADQINEKNSLTGEVITSQSPFFLNKTDLRERADRNCVIGTVPVFWLGVPLKIEGEVIGVMATQIYEEPGRFDKTDLNIMNSVSDQVALAIERKRNEQALVESERKYRNIIRTIEDGYYETDLDGNLTLTNQALCNMLGYAEEELLGKSTASCMDGTSDEAIKRSFRAVLDSSRSGKPLALQLRRKDGSLRFVETVVSAITNENDIQIGFRGIARDITERINAEKERKAMEAKLQQSQRLESLGTLAGGIAHDFNNILMGIQGRVELMLHNIGDEHPHHHQLVQIKNYLHSAAGLTRRLLGFARGGKYEVRTLNLNALLDKSIKMFGPTKKEISIHCRSADNLPPIEADASQIEQVLLNMLVNAGQAMPKGGTITIETATRNIGMDEARFQDISPGDYIQLSISDNGKGMSMETMKKIFDPFFTTKPTGHGTGLGLAMAYGFIRNHAGAISVDSTIDKGTCFTLLLPASKKPLSLEEPLPHTVAKGSEIILLVDDEPMILEIGREILAALGYEVLTASSGKEAIDVYSRNRDQISLSILDMIMPHMSGGELFDRMAAINPQVKVLLASGYSIEGEAREILGRGCKGFIQKPFSISELSQKIRTILS